MASGPQVGNTLCGRHFLPSTSQRTGRGTKRRRSPSPVEVEGGHVHTPRKTRYRRHSCITGGIGLGGMRGSIPARVSSGRGGDVAPTENGRTSDGFSHSPVLMNAAVLASQNARRAAGNTAQPRGLRESTPQRTQPGYQALSSSDGVQLMASDTTLRSRGSRLCSQDARRVGNSFAREGSFGGGNIYEEAAGVPSTPHRQWY